MLLSTLSTTNYWCLQRRAFPSQRLPGLHSSWMTRGYISTPGTLMPAVQNGPMLGPLVFSIT